MRRRSRASGNSPNAQAPKAAAGKSLNAQQSARPRSSSAAREEAKIARLNRERDEALQQQRATATLLKVISRSTFDLQVVFETLVESAAKLCKADLADIWRPNGSSYRVAASYQTTAAQKEYLATLPITPGRGSCVGRTLLEAKIVHIPDIREDAEYALDLKKLGERRTTLGVPLLRDGKPIGVIALIRNTVRPFTSRQIELVTTFADQAVIAIENARLLSELRQRTTDLTESLEQQTATSEVLRVISSSPGELQPVFDAMLENAVRICDATYGNIYSRDGDSFRLVASYKTPPAFTEYRRRNPMTGSGAHWADPMLRSKTQVHIADLSLERGFIERHPSFVAAVELGRARSALAVPMLKEGEIIGAFAVARQEVRPFTEKQIALVTNLAAQAVIAIENTRLLNELRQRTHELGRSVEELRALGEVSQAVNSTLELETVLSTIVANAVQLSGTEAGAIYVFDDRQREFRLRATYGMDRELIDALAHADMRVNEPNISLILAERDVIHVADLRDEASNEINDITMRAGFRARLIAPLMRGEDVVGLLVVRRRAPGTFPQSIVDLIKTFAAQSAVAIENARLFQNVDTSLKELRTAQDRLVQTQKLASLGQLTAGIAHEIKNPLNFVNNFSGVSVEMIEELREALDKMKGDTKTRAEITELTDTLRDNLNKIVQHGKRADSIVKNMLLHSREGSGEHRLVDINALVEEAVNLAYHGARAEKQGFNIELERSLDPAAGQVDCFPQEITRVLLNLLSNGFYAATKREAQANRGYEPTLTAATRSLGDRVEIRIRDNGTGIPPEVREKMFNPFFTTKPAGEGTGLGLSISHDIIVKHSGLIEIDSQPDEYTEVRIVLPRAAAFPR
jgi:GAF domain-containing protein/anti-sigma regulatory factor (Ser/Thr protein kinase)